MPRARKARTFRGLTRSIVAQNLGNLVRNRYAAKPNITQQQRALSAECGVTFSTIQRIMNEGVAAEIETLEQIATVFELSVYQLTLPGLDVRNPQVVKGATAAEQRLYAELKKARLSPAQKSSAERTATAVPQTSR